MQRRKALSAVVMTHRAIHVAVLICLYNACYARSEEPARADRATQADAGKSVIEKSRHVGERINLTGIAGYLDDKRETKGETPCLWLLGDNRSVTEYELVGITQWDERLIGRKITIVGTVTNVPAARPELQMRAPRDAQETMLVKVRLKNGSMVEPAHIDHTNGDPFLAEPTESQPNK